MQVNKVNVDGKFTFSMANAKKLPLHFATIYKAGIRIPCNEKMACAPLNWPTRPSKKT
jgi:hypothetical protein